MYYSELLQVEMLRVRLEYPGTRRAIVLAMQESGQRRKELWKEAGHSSEWISLNGLNYRTGPSALMNHRFGRRTLKKAG